MPKYSIKKNHEREMRAIFNNPNYSKIPHLSEGFMSVEDVETEALLFVGLNPAIPKKLKFNSNFYPLGQKDNKYREFFGKFEEIAQEVAMTWSHLDLLMLKESQQSVVKDLLYDPKLKAAPFFFDQLKVSKKILEASKPQIIVVTSTLGRLFTGKMQAENENVWMGYTFKFDPILGTDVITNEDSALKGTPVFFTTLLSGPKALDLGSYERLVWHIGKVKELLNKK